MCGALWLQARRGLRGICHLWGLVVTIGIEPVNHWPFILHSSSSSCLRDRRCCMAAVKKLLVLVHSGESYVCLRTSLLARQTVKTPHENFLSLGDSRNCDRSGYDSCCCRACADDWSLGEVWEHKSIGVLLIGAVLWQEQPLKQVKSHYQTRKSSIMHVLCWLSDHSYGGINFTNMNDSDGICKTRVRICENCGSSLCEQPWQDPHILDWPWEGFSNRQWN